MKGCEYTPLPPGDAAATGEDAAAPLAPPRPHARVVPSHRGPRGDRAAARRPRAHRGRDGEAAGAAERAARAARDGHHRRPAD
eukprot:768228-Prymnesium_polylepis.1